MAKTPKPGQKVTLKPTKKGQKKITYTKGGLHKSLGVPQGQPIPPAKFQAALAGKYGPLAKRQAQFKQNVLKGGKNKKAVKKAGTMMRNQAKMSGSMPQKGMQ